MEKSKSTPMLRDLPSQPKKGKIYEMYGRQLSVNSMKTNIDALIEDFKKLTGAKLNSREVPRAVWLEWLKTYGFPFGYEQKLEWLQEVTIFDKKQL